MVSPLEIRLCTRREYDKVRDLARIQGGDWDLNVTPFDEEDVWWAFEDHFSRGIPWTSTEFFDRVVRTIESGTEKWGCTTRDEFVERCDRFDDLYSSIERDGFLSQAELARTASASEPADDISVCIGRDGEILFEDGRHRLCIAKLLDVDSIPVQVSLRHREWADVARQIRAFARTHGGEIYAPLHHPDFGDMSERHGDDRFELIQSELPIRSGSLLDIGAHWGYITRRFDELGFDCVAVEYDPRHAQILRKMNAAERSRVKVYEGSIFEYEELSAFDVVLALNIFHHFLKERETLDALESFLERLDARCIVFQAHLFEEPQMTGAYRNMRPDEFASWVAEHAGLSRVAPIGRASDGRSVYLIT